MGLFTKNKTEKSESGAKAGKESSQSQNKTTVSKKTDDAKTMKNLYKDKVAGAKSSKKVGATDSAKISKNAYRVLIKPLITEKASRLAEENKYCFEVAVNANKIEVAKAVSAVYGVSPVAVNMVNVIGKKVRRGRSVGKRKDWKKAIVALPKGKTIEIYEGI